MRDGGMRISETRAQVIWFEIGIVRENRFGLFALRQQTENQLYRNSHSANDWFAAEDFRIGGYSSKELLINHDGFDHTPPASQSKNHFARPCHHDCYSNPLPPNCG